MCALMFASQNVSVYPDTRRGLGKQVREKATVTGSSRLSVTEVISSLQMHIRGSCTVTDRIRAAGEAYDVRHKVFSDVR